MNWLSACQAQIICYKEDIYPKVLEYLDDILKKVKNTSEDGNNSYLYYFFSDTDMLQYLDPICIILKRLGYTVLVKKTNSDYVEPLGQILIKW